ncbi:MAG: hypothetical protein ACI8UO_002985 [Verrucomicrobiales bacterium]|jgi:hypothetical protein
MSTTLEQLNSALGTEKFTVLATVIDQLRCFQAEIASGVDLDDRIETLDVADLAEEHGVSFETMRKELRSVAGKNAVFRLGKKWVIRKQRFLDYLQTKESDAS